MIAFAWNLLLALAWGALTGSFTVVNLLFGFLVGFLVLRITLSNHSGFATYSRKLPKFIAFAGYFLVELVWANLRVAYDVITPTHLMRPGVVAVPLDATTNGQITTLANLISLTPGTLSLDVSTDRKVLYIHAMYIDDEQILQASIKDLERRVMDLLS